MSRWSRLKRGTVEPEPVEAPPPVDETAELPVLDEVPADVAQPEAEDPLKDLPPVEELTAESDFTPFLRAEVPEDLHRQALRKLWTSDPIYANDDGLKDYADDYASLFTGGVPVKTLYRVGSGFLDTLDDVAEETAAEPSPVPGEGGDPRSGEGEGPSQNPEPT
nr:DUF3306 domain-containing protein [Azospirillum endophyticum]